MHFNNQRKERIKTNNRNNIDILKLGIEHEPKFFNRSLEIVLLGFSFLFTLTYNKKALQKYLQKGLQ